MRKLKKISALLLVMVLVLSTSALMGCGNNEPAAPEPAETADTNGAEEGQADDGGDAPAVEAGVEPVTLRVTWWGNTDRDKLYAAINDLFMAEHPHVTIVTESPGWGDYWPAVATAFASGTAPDVVQFQSSQIGDYTGMNVLTPLDSFVEDGTIVLDNWNMDLVNTGVIDGNLYMVTLGITACALYVNYTLLNELGIEIWDEDEDITWEEFVDFMDMVQEAMGEGGYAIMDFSMNNDLIWIWVRQNTPAGVEWVDANGEFAPSEEALASWFELTYELRSRDAIPPLTLAHEWEQLSWPEGPFANRHVAFHFANANQINHHQGAIDDQIVMRSIPIAPDAYNAHGDILITSSFAISETSENKELAAKYINFFVNNLEAQYIFNYELGVPGSLTVQEMLAELEDPGNIMQSNYVNRISANVLPFIPQVPGTWAVVTEIERTADQVAMGMMTPTEAAQFIISIASQIIAENQTR